MTSRLSHEDSVIAQWQATERANRMGRFEEVTPADESDGIGEDALKYAPPLQSGRLFLNPDFNPNHADSDSNPYWVWREVV